MKKSGEKIKVNFLTFPVFWVKFPDFSSLFRIPWLFRDWKKFSHFPGFPVYVGTMTFLRSAPTFVKTS